MGLSRKEKEMIVSTRQVFEAEKKLFEEKVKSKKLKDEEIPINYKNVLLRTAETLHVNQHTVKRVFKEFDTTGQVSQPRHKNAGRKRFVLDSFDEGVIRRIILTGYSNKIVPTLDYIHKQIKEDPYFRQLSKNTLRRVIRKQMGCKFGKFQGKPVPLDRPDIAAHRARYLRQIRKFRKENYRIYYQDESWVNENIGVDNGWHIPEKPVIGQPSRTTRLDPWLRGIGRRFRDGMLGGIATRPTGAGKRIILVNVGSEDGFLGVGKEFVGQKNTGDYHSEMNAEHFQEWFTEVVAALPDRSVIVLDQASYHTATTPESRNPNASFLKNEIIRWLEERGVPVPADEESFHSMTKTELLQLTKEYAIPPEIAVEKILAAENQTNPSRDLHLLWLPVAHCELNPIELMWAAAKGEIKKRNSTFKMRDLLPLTKEVIQSSELDQLWPACVRHVVELEELIMEKEKIADDFIERTRERIIIEIGGDSSSDSSSDEE